MIASLCEVQIWERSKMGKKESKSIQALLCLIVWFLYYIITEFGLAGFAPFNTLGQLMAPSANLSALTDTTDIWYFPNPVWNEGTGWPNVSASQSLWMQYLVFGMPKFFLLMRWVRGISPAASEASRQDEKERIAAIAKYCNLRVS